VLAKRRHDQLEDGESVVEVLAEAAGAHLAGEIAVGNATTRTSTRFDAGRADRLDLAICSARNSFAWTGNGSSPTSSSTRVPPSAWRRIRGAPARRR